MTLGDRQAMENALGFPPRVDLLTQARTAQNKGIWPLAAAQCQIFVDAGMLNQPGVQAYLDLIKR